MPATPAQALAAYRHRVVRVSARMEWFGQQIIEGLEIEFDKRLETVGQLLRDKVVANISLPVERSETGRVIQRSIRGEFPRAETTRLMKDIFWEKTSRAAALRPGGSLGVTVGTTLDYGLYLEVNLDRSFLRRTLEEERETVERILTRRVN
jgi:hypothetical protein